MRILSFCFLALLLIPACAFASEEIFADSGMEAPKISSQIETDSPDPLAGYHPIPVRIEHTKQGKIIFRPVLDYNDREDWQIALEGFLKFNANPINGQNGVGTQGGVALGVLFVKVNDNCDGHPPQSCMMHGMILEVEGGLGNGGAMLKENIGYVAGLTGEPGWSGTYEFKASALYMSGGPIGYLQPGGTSPSLSIQSTTYVGMEADVTFMRIWKMGIGAYKRAIGEQPAPDWLVLITAGVGFE